MEREYVAFHHFNGRVDLSLRVKTADDMTMHRFSTEKLLIVLELIRQLVTDLKAVEAMPDPTGDYEPRV